MQISFYQFTESGVIEKIGDLKIHKDKKIGSGTFGYVFEGEIQSRPCAVKVLLEIGRELVLNLPITSENITIQEARLNAFEKEYKYLLDLKHPNIVELIAVCCFPQNNAPCIVMELLDCSLRSYLKSCYPSRVHQISLSSDIAKALHYLHNKKLIHRDLCGDNILIKKGEAIPLAKISDFGISRIIDHQTMTHSFSVLGHRNGYLPPEGLSKDYDLSLDVFMFGVIMIQIVCEAPDVRSPEERKELLKNVADNHPLKKFIDRCVVDSKSERPTANNLCNELQNLLDTHTASPNMNSERLGGSNEANVCDVGALNDLL